MKTRILLAALAFASLLALPASAQRDTRSTGAGGERRSDGPYRRDWTDTVVRTPEGGFRMGDPNAPVKLVEYVSLTCPHCAEFAHLAGERLFLLYVRNGRVSVEYRNYTLNGFDLAAAFLSRCARPRQYFDLTHYLLGHQPEWMGRMQALTEAQRSELRTLSPIQAMQRLVPLLGLDRIAARHGIDRNGQAACLADERALNRLGEMRQAADAAGVEGTPTFFINGRSVGAQSWATLEPMLTGR